MSFIIPGVGRFESSKQTNSVFSIPKSLIGLSFSPVLSPYDKWLCQTRINSSDALNRYHLSISYSSMWWTSIKTKNLTITQIKFILFHMLRKWLILPELVAPSSLQYQDFCFLAPTHILERLYCCSNWDTSVSVYACCTVELNSISLPPSDTQSDCELDQDLYELLFTLIHLSFQLVRWDGHTTDPLLGPTREGYHNVTMS